MSNDYTYTAATVSAPTPTTATLDSPLSGSTLSAAVVQLNWSPGTTATQYWLYVGTSRGGRELYSGSQGTRLGAAVSGVPTNGTTVYIRLWSLTTNGWHYNDYSYPTATI